MASKDWQRLKRKHEQQELHRRQNISPYHSAANASGEFRCYCTQDWQEQGITSILVMKTLPSGGRVLGAYLVDFWCCGLKDAWGRLDITAAEFEQAIDRAEQNGAAMAEMALGLVQDMVAGAIRFAKQNGFRLPHRYERWVALIGVDPAAPDADLGMFGIDERGKKLRYLGPMADLERRLVGSTAQEFLSRPDVEFVLGGEGSFEDQDRDSEQDEADDQDDQDAEDVEQAAEQLRQEMHSMLLEKVRQWCFANQQPPHPALPEAIDTLLESLMQIQSPADVALDAPEVVDQAHTLLEQALEMHGPAKCEQLTPALMQLADWIGTFPSPQELFEAMGVQDQEE